MNCVVNILRVCQLCCHHPTNSARNAKEQAINSSSEEIGLLHDPQEFLLIHLPIAITVCLINHLLKLLVRHALAKLLATRFKFLNEIFPVSSSSNRRNAFKISSLGSRFRILWVIIFKNSSYSIVPLPSSSTSEIIFWISSF